MSEKVTLVALAREAHVSISTASNALNDRGRVSPRTRRLVQLKAQEIGYKSHHRENITSRHSGLVGLVTSDLEGRFCIPALIGAEDQLGAARHSVLLTNSRGELQLEREHTEQLVTRGIDGLLVLNADPNPRRPLDTDLTMGIPVIYVYSPSTDRDDCSIIPDNYQAGYDAIHHLIEIGRENIAIISGDETFSATTERLRGAQAAFDQAGLEPVMPLQFGSWREDWGRAAAFILCNGNAKFDAIYCMNDQIARGAITVIEQLGLSVPTDVAIVGHDNWNIFVLDSRPTITSFDNNAEKIGRLAAQYLLDAINGKAHHGVTKIKCSLIKRESTLPVI